MAARELERVSKRGNYTRGARPKQGRIYLLPAQEFGHPAEGGAELVHGAAPVTGAPNAQGAATAIVDLGRAVEWPHRRALAGRGTASSSRPILPNAPGLIADLSIA